MNKAVAMAATLLVAIAATGSVALAVDTPVPASTQTMLNGLYAGSTLVRVSDAFDQLWVSEAGNATATARYAGYTNTFGYIGGWSGLPSATFTGAITVPSGNASLPVSPLYQAALPSPSAQFRFGLNANGVGPIWSSLNSDNTDGGLDHMVTYYIAAGLGVGNYVIAFEDLPGPAPGSDRDFDDLVVTIAGARPTPEPGTLLLFGSAAAGLFAWSRRSRKAAVKA